MAEHIVEIVNKKNEILYRSKNFSYKELLEYHSKMNHEITGASFKDEDFSNIKLGKGHLKNVVFRRVNFENADFHYLLDRIQLGIFMEGCQFYECNFKNANFYHARCADIYFNVCDFENAKFDNSQFRRGGFEGCNLKNASFDDASLWGCNFKYQKDIESISKAPRHCNTFISELLLRHANTEPQKNLATRIGADSYNFYSYNAWPCIYVLSRKLSLWNWVKNILSKFSEYEKEIAIVEKEHKEGGQKYIESINKHHFKNSHVTPHGYDDYKKDFIENREAELMRIFDKLINDHPNLIPNPDPELMKLAAKLIEGIKKIDLI